MGWLDTARDLIRASSPGPNAAGSGELARGAIESLIAAEIEERLESFTVHEALQLPSVSRAFDLITSIGASFDPVAYVNGEQVELPRIVGRPDPFTTRHDWTIQALGSMFTTGDLFLLLDGEGTARSSSALVLDPIEVQVAWDDRRFRRRYTWRERELQPDVELKHVTIGRRPGQLHGTSPLQRVLRHLAPLYLAEQYGAAWFGSGGVPSTVIKTAAELTDAEARRLREQYVTSRAEAALRGEPAVAGGGVELEFPGGDPHGAQLVEARDYGNTLVARTFGIPAPLLLVTLGGSSLTYQNVGQVVHMFARQTLLPLWLTPIESALGDLAGRRYQIRYSTAELERADAQTRVRIYRELVAMGAIDPAEVRLAEGWPTGQLTDIGVQHTPAPPLRVSGDEPARIPEVV